MVVLGRQPDIRTRMGDVLFSVEVWVSVGAMVVDVSECLERGALVVSDVSGKHHMPGNAQRYARRGLGVLV